MSFDEREYARKRAEARQQSSWYKLKEGDNSFRILPTPPTKDVRTNFFEYGIHRDVGPKKQVVRCGIDPVSGEGECWLCDVKIPALKKKRLDSRAALLAPKSNFLVQIAKVDGDGKMTGPFLFTPAKTIADQLLASIFGSRKRSYVDPKLGYNLSINRTGTGKNDTRYGIIEPDQEPSRVPQALLDKLKPFEELKEVPVYSKAKQSAAYTGQDVVDDEEDEDEAPRKSATRRPVVEDDEDDAAPEDADVDDDDVDDEDLDEEDEPAPKSKKAAVVDPDEDEDDAEPPAPKTRGKHKAAAPEPEADDIEDEDLNEEEPAPKKASAKPKSKVAEPEEDDPIDPDDEDIPDDLEEDDPEPAPSVSKPKAGKSKKDPEPEPEDDPDDEDIDLDDIEDEDLDDEEPAPKPAPKKVVSKPKAKARR